MINLPEQLKNKIEKRKETNSFRVLNTFTEGVDFYSNDYLGFSSSKKIHDRSINILESEPCLNGSTGSRLISGTHPLHLKAEDMLAKYHNSQSALLYNSGYDANVGLFSSILQKGDVLFYDELLHASCRDGILLSNAKSYKFQHNSIEDLKSKILRFKNNVIGSIYIAVESVYSMDGDTAPLLELVALSREYNIRLIVDEAHSNGVFGERGKGLISHLQLEKYCFARVHTFGKALGCHGAVILGSQDLKDYLINFSKSFIYTTALSPHSVSIIISSYLELENRNYTSLLQNKISFFKKQIQVNQLDHLFVESDSAIQCCLVSGNDAVKKIEENLKQEGFLVKAVLSPTVAKDKERIRICLHLFNSEDQIVVLLKKIASFFKPN